MVRSRSPVRIRLQARGLLDHGDRVRGAPSPARWESGHHAVVAQQAARHLAKVQVAGSIPVSRSRGTEPPMAQSLSRDTESPPTAELA